MKSKNSQLTRDVTVKLTYTVSVTLRVPKDMNDLSVALLAEDYAHPGHFELYGYDISNAHPKDVLSNV